jgi:CHAT domain-containing protein
MADCLCVLLVFASCLLGQVDGDGRSSERERAIARGFKAAREAYRFMGSIRGVPEYSTIARLSLPPLPGDDEQGLINRRRGKSGTLSTQVDHEYLPYYISLLKQRYPARTGVLFYVCEDTGVTTGSSECEHIAGWLIKPDPEPNEAVTDVLISSSDLSKAHENLRRSLTERSRTSRGAAVRKQSIGEIQANVKASIPELTNLLLPPHLRKRLETIRHLIVVPTGAIGTIPFALLEPFEDGSVVVEHMSISVAPSIFDLAHPVEVWRYNFHTPLIVGAPELPDNWVPLPGAQREVERVATLLQSKPLVAKQASRSNVNDRAEIADLLYFATHGMANPDDPLKGFLALSGSTPVQIAWTASDIQKSHMVASLAVLSACQTGLGMVHDAGIIGLARAFQIAGVPRVVMSLWDVNDEATTDLMLAFIDNTREHIPADALRSAMLDAKKKGRDPNIWASFVLFGTPR